jgi:hypothetical protein
MEFKFGAVPLGAIERYNSLEFRAGAEKQRKEETLCPSREDGSPC